MGPAPDEDAGPVACDSGRIGGAGDSDNRYALKGPTVFVFNVFDIAASAYVHKAEMEAICREA
ncbi:MAG: hypothetical protein R3C05_13920 [Pirellulaceae bacterium]